jgi:hypothetical protein
MTLEQQFTANASAGGSETMSETLRQQPGMTNLFFLRAGLMPQPVANTVPGYGKSCFISVGNNYQDNRVINRIPESEFIHVDGFVNQETTLNPGYLYIVEDKNPKQYYEYKVTDGGVLFPILWTENNLGDIREPRSENCRYVSFRNGTVVWVAYSPVQWTRRFVEQITNDSLLREKIMHRVDCKSVEQSDYASLAPRVLTIKNVHPAFSLTIAEAQQQAAYRQIIIGNEMSLIYHMETTESLNNFNNTFDDLFIVLDDPIGCATDIALQLQEEHLKMDVLLESIQTGESEASLIARLEAKDDAEDEEEAEKIENAGTGDIGYIPVLALLLNSVFNGAIKVETQNKMSPNTSETKLEKFPRPTAWKSNDLPQKHKNAVYNAKSKIDKVLGVVERAEIKAIIGKLRSSLEKYLKSDYAQEGFKIYLDNEAVASIGGISLFEGRRLLTSLLALLSAFPHDKDRHLTLPQHVKKSEEDDISIIEFLRAIDEGGQYACYSDMVNGELKLDYIIKDYIENGTLSRRFVRDNDGLTLLLAVRDMINGTTEQLVRLNYTNFKPSRFRLTVENGQTILEFRKSEFKTFTSNTFGAVRKPDNLASNRRGVFRVILNDDQIDEFNKNQNFRFNNHRNPQVEAFFNASAFKGALAGLELLNLIVKICNANVSKNFLRDRDTYDILSSTLMTTHFMLEWRISVRPDLRRVGIFKYSTQIGIAAAAAGMVVAVIDTCSLFRVGDTNAAIASIGLALINGGLLAGMILSFAPLLMLGLVAGAFIVGIIVLLLIDDDMELFLKNNIIGSKVKCEPGNLRPAEYTRLLYNKRTDLVTQDSLQRFFDPEYALTYMKDFLPSFSVELFHLDKNPRKIGFIKNPDNTIIVHDTPDLPRHVKVYVPHLVMVRVRCNQFFPNKSCLDYSLFLGYSRLTPGFHTIKPEEIEDYVNYPYATETSSWESGMRYIRSNDGVYYLDIFYEIPNDIIDKLVECFEKDFRFEARLVLDKNATTPAEQGCWPMDYKGSERFIEHKFDAYRYNKRYALGIHTPSDSKLYLPLKTQE